MQVADRTEHVTHAVLGGMSNISFGISDDPAFFQILSSALYKEPTRAMVRETICNGWDAHIDSGRADRPLTITIDDEKLVIRDYGKGIPHDLIGPIYGIYGASTKKNDGRQTGGFGLGCKSPFAYTDHFEVVSFHEGVRTIYNMSKSSAEKMGKPSIVPIASFPTDESGIQVTIELTNSEHEHLLMSLVRQVVFGGDIMATLNGEMLPRLGLSNAASGFVLMNDNADADVPYHHLWQHRVYVRYGNVIYPVEGHDDIEPMFGKVQNLLSRFYGCRVVLMAPPDSISITPSRESLTMSTLTSETLKGLFSAFLGHLMHNREISVKHEQLVEGYIDTASNSQRPLSDKLYIGSWGVPGIPSVHEKKFLSTIEDFAKLEVLLRYSGKNGTLPVNKWLYTINRYLGNMRDAGLIPRGLLSTWQQTARKAKRFMNDPSKHRYVAFTKTESESERATTWWRKRVMLPLANKLSAALGDTVRDGLYYFSGHVKNAEQKAGYQMPTNVRGLYLSNHTRNLVHMVKPTVILCHNAERLPFRLGHNQRGLSTGTLQMGAAFVLVIPRKEESVDKAKSGLSQLVQSGDIEFLDMTGRTELEQREYEERTAVAAGKRAAFLLANPGKTKGPRKAKAGLVRLDQLIVDGGFDTTAMVNDENALRLTSPKFIEKVSTGEEHRRYTDDFKDGLLMAVTKLWGDQGVVTNNKAVFTKQTEEMGIMSLKAFVVDKVVNEIVTSPELIAHMQFDEKKADSYLAKNQGYHKARDIGKIYSLLINNMEFNSLVPGYTPLTMEDHLKLTVWHKVLDDYSWNQDPAIRQAAKSVEDLKLAKSTTDFLDELCANSFLGLLDQDNLGTIARGSRKDPLKMAKLKAILSEIIN